MASTDTDDAVEGFSSTSQRKATDADFISHSRQDIPALLAVADAAERYLQSLGRHHDDCEPHGCYIGQMREAIAALEALP